MKVKHLVELLLKEDQEQEVKSKGPTGTFERYVRVRRSNHKDYKGNIMIEGWWKDETKKKTT
jgi:hypothetical protein